MKRYVEFIKKTLFALSVFIIIPLVLYLLAMIFSFIGLILQIYMDLLTQYVGVNERGAEIVCFASICIAAITLVFAVIDFIHHVPETTDSKEKS